MRILNFFKKNTKLLISIVALFILILVFFRLVFPIGIISSGDFTFLDRKLLEEWIKTLSFIWTSYSGLGFNALPTIGYFGFFLPAGFLALLGFDYGISARVIFFIPLVGATFLGCYLLGKKLFDRSLIAFLIFPVIFLVNVDAYQLISWPNMGVAYALIPLIFWAVLSYIENKNRYFILIISLLLSISLLYEIRITFISFLISFLLIVFKLLHKPKDFSSKTVLDGILVILLIFGICSFMILPIFFGKSALSVSDITSQPLFGVSFFDIQHSIALVHPYWTGHGFKVFIPQPIIPYFWLYPFFAFSSLFFAKRSRYITFFAILALLGVFLGKGASSPFGGIYSWLYYNLPVFNFFREPVEWWAITSFSYAVLIAFFFKYYFEIIQKENLFFKKIILESLLFLPILLLTATVALPVINGKIDSIFVSRNIPNEYKVLRNFLIKDSYFYRTISVPIAQRFIYFDNLHPLVGFTSLPNSIKGLNEKILSLESIKYVILPSDPLNDIYRTYGFSDSFDSYIKSSIAETNNTLAKNFGGITIWENKNYLPHIMPVRELVYVNGTGNLQNIVDIPTLPDVAYYFENNGPEGIDENATRDSIMLKNSTKIYSVADCVRCDLDKQYTSYAKIPYARFLPDSPLYPLIIWKEQKTLSSLAYPQKLLQEAFLSEKRTVEIDSMINKNIQKEFIKSTMFQNLSLISDVNSKILENQPIGNEDLLSIDDFFSLERKILKDKFPDVKEADVQEVFLGTIDKLDILRKNLLEKIWKTEGNDKKLFLSIPEDGKYQISIKNDSEVNIEESSLSVNGVKFPLRETSDKYSFYGESSFTKGVYKVEMDTNPINLISTSASSLNLFSDSSSEKFKIPLKTLSDPQSVYQISFDYKVNKGVTPRILVVDEVNPKDLSTGLAKSILNQSIENHGDGKWHHFTAFFKPPEGILKPNLIFWFLNIDEKNSVEIDNLFVNKVYFPTIIFSKDNNKTLGSPSIRFQEMNPNDYSVSVSSVNEPYLLSFSEGFDKNWRAYLTNDEEKTDNKIVASYINGRVQELPYLNKPDFPSFLNTFLYPSLPENIHAEVNGFGNAWLINKSGSYTIHLVYLPQRYFLIGLFISITSFIIILLISVFLLGKKYLKN